MSGRLLKVLLVSCGTLCVALGVIGIFLPLMPTTVFLLMAAACYARSSDRFYQKLINHRLLGEYIRNSREGRGMRRRDKTVTLALLWIGIGASIVWTAHTLWLRLLLLAIATAVTVHVARLPLFNPAAQPQPDRAQP
ncbi:MAG TPA: YbaN family protein [Vicinamibacterales bacterium]|nr:YbaN family protein [Vicinamibacterales bacterium]